MARTFDGSTEYITHVRPGNLTSGQSATMAAWFKHPNTSNAHIIMGVRNGDSGDGNWTSLRFGDDAGEIEWIHDFFGPGTKISSGQQDDDDAWRHACGTYNGTDMKLYINGVLKTTSSSFTNGTLATTNTWKIGRRSDFDAEYFNGEIAEVSWWNNVALDASQILALYNRFSPLFFPNGLDLYFPLIGRSSPEIELMQSLNGTLTGTGNFDHPPIIYPSQSRIIIPPSAISTSVRDLLGSGIIPFAR